MLRVLSVSRRSDIPAFYLDWFSDGIAQGFFDVKNPRSGRVSRIAVSPGTVQTILFWSKNYEPFLEQRVGETLIEAGYGLFFQFTVNSENRVLEPGVPSLESRFSQLRILSDRFGSDHVSWRFDPVCQYRDENGYVRNNLADFPEIARQAARSGIRRCTVSFADPYPKVLRRFSRKNMEMIDPDINWKHAVIERMLAVLSPLDIRLFLCCEPEVLQSIGDALPVSPSACVDGRLLRELNGGKISIARDTGQRQDHGCGCTRSSDIGSYSDHPCKHNCLYCYARPDSGGARG